MRKTQSQQVLDILAKVPHDGSDLIHKLLEGIDQDPNSELKRAVLRRLLFSDETFMTRLCEKQESLRRRGFDNDHIQEGLILFSEVRILRFGINSFKKAISPEKTASFFIGLYEFAVSDARRVAGSIRNAVLGEPDEVAAPMKVEGYSGPSFDEMTVELSQIQKFVMTELSEGRSRAEIAQCLHRSESRVGQLIRESICKVRRRRRLLLTSHLDLSA